MEDRKPANLSNRTVATASGTDPDDELGRVGEGDNAILPAFKIWTVAGSLTPASRDPQTLPNRFLLINPHLSIKRPGSPLGGNVAVIFPKAVSGPPPAEAQDGDFTVGWIWPCV